MRIIFSFIVVSLLLSSCVSKQWIQTRNVCSEKSYEKFPIVLQTVRVEKFRQVEVPDGTTTCTKIRRVGGYYGASTTTCTHGTKFINERYYDWESQDINTDLRNQAIQECTIKTCTKKFGNPNCKIPES